MLDLAPDGAGGAAEPDDQDDRLKLRVLAAACVLLVAGANQAKLMLARGWKDRAQTSVRVVSGAPRRRLVRKALVVAQAAMSLDWLTAAALLAQSLRNLEHQNFGFETTDREIACINPTLSGDPPEQMGSMGRTRPSFPGCMKLQAWGRTSGS